MPKGNRTAKGNPAFKGRKKKPDGRRPAALLPMQILAIDAYFENDFVKKDAMLTAGYSLKTATGNPQSVFDKPLVVAEIARRHAKLAKKHEVTQDWVIERYKAIADAGMLLAKFKKVGADGELYWDFTGATPEDLAVVNELATEIYTEGKGPRAEKIKKFKIGISDPKAALDSLARHLGMFNDKLDVTVGASLVERLQAGRNRTKQLT